MPTNQIMVRLLGGLCLETDQRKVERFATRKIGALLAYLAFHPDRPHAREQLIDRF